MHATADDLPTMRVDFSLSAKQITAVFSLIVAAVGALGTAGWLVLPAKQTDLLQLQEQFRQMQEVTGRLTSAVNDLVVSVDQLRVAPVKVIEKRTQVIRQAPARAPAGGTR